MAQPPSAWIFTTDARTNLLEGEDNWSTDSFKIALFTSASGVGPTSTTYSSLTNEVANGNGYTTGGAAVDLTLTGTTTVAVNFTSNVVWTGSGSGISAYYAVVYAVTSGNIICYCVLDSTPQNVVIAAGATLTISNTVTPLATLS